MTRPEPHPIAVRRHRAAPPPRAPLEIGLVNNMPDAALQATERQFAGLIAAAAGEDMPVRLRLYSLPQVPRGDYARQHMRGAYADVDALPGAGLDALIVTGAEPMTARLTEEAYWNGLSDLVDFAAGSTLSTIWSCLAAHAAVLRLDNIQRIPLKTKRSGVFRARPLVEDPLLEGLHGSFLVPHSRQNSLSETVLKSAGYQVLTRSPAGPDLFVKRARSLFVFFQGHPEYELQSLPREYLRDVGRFLRGERDSHPAAPAGIFTFATRASLCALARKAIANPDPALGERYAEIVAAAAPAQRWRTPAVRIYRNWLSALAERKAGRAESRLGLEHALAARPA